MSSTRDLVWEDDPKDPDRSVARVGRMVVTVPKNYVRPRPVFCPVCSRPMREVDDIRAYSENECCSFCDIHFARPKRDQWKAGWRPSKEQVDSLIEERYLDLVSENVLGR